MPELVHGDHLFLRKEFQLSLCVLVQIWGLSDIDKDGSLDLDEFCVVSLYHPLLPINSF